MKMSPVIFREYDIRGVVDQDFDSEFAYHLGRAYISLTKAKLGLKQPPLICIGQDARQSSNNLVERLAQGMTDSGAHVRLLGLVTTPVTYFTTFALKDVNGAIMVTGSHNPPEYNGFKISVGPSTIFGQDIQELERIIQAQDYVTAAEAGKVENFDVLPLYIERYAQEFGDLKGLPIVLDCGNGAAGSVARRMYESVGLKPQILFEEPDGRFPNHHPDPTVEENLEDLKKAVIESGSIIGIGFDGDADRIGVVDNHGKMILGDEIIALCSRFILEERPGEKIIGDVKCSDRMYDYIEKYGGQPIMWKTGHSLVKQKIKDEKAPFGGELSGHIFFADRNYGYDDALYAGLRVIEILVKTQKNLGQLLSDLPSAHNTPEIRIDTTEEKKHSIVKAIKEHFEEKEAGVEVNLIDGIRVSFPFGWALARASNTQPVLVLRFEADSKENLDKIRSRFEKIVEPLL